MAGRPRKPTALHVLNGNPSKIPDLEMRFAQEPQFEPFTAGTVPDPPEHLPDLAKDCWRENAAPLASQHLLTVVDLKALESYCIAYWAMRQCLAEAARVGTLVYKPHAKTQPNSTYLDLLPQARAIKEYAKMMLEHAREFGMTPASRGRMVSPDARAEEDEMAALIRGAR